MIRQCTIGDPVSCQGVGIHSGIDVTLTLRPAPAGEGIVFRRVDQPVETRNVPARHYHVSDTRLGTRLENAQGTSVSTVEHVLAACAGMGIDNLYIELDGAEVPILDGSALPYCGLIAAAGCVEQLAPRRVLRVVQPVEVSLGRAVARLLPDQGSALTLEARIDFTASAIGHQTYQTVLSPGTFRTDIAFARTFGFLQDMKALRAQGLAQGGSLDNAVVLDGDGILNPGGLRAPDEFVRHKVLDAIGDLYLAGGAIAGRYEAICPGHAINALLLKTWLDTPEAWKLDDLIAAPDVEAA